MNEQSVNNIIAYIQQYPDVATEELVGNILQSGYKMEDLKEALRRQGISPIVIPGYVEPDPPPPKPFFTRMPVIIVGIVIGLLLIVVSAWFILSPQKQEQTQEPTSRPTPLPKTPTPTIPHIVVSQMATTPTVTKTTEDPLKVFRNTFDSADYKVTIDDTAANQATDTFSASNVHETSTAYTDHGTLIRLEKSKTITIYKDKKAYILDPSQKKYTVLKSDELNDFSFIPSIMIAESKHNRILWEKLSDSQWHGIWNINTAKGTYTNVIIILDEKTDLLNKLSTQAAATTSTQDIILHYEKISDPDIYTVIPSEYTQLTDSTKAQP